MINAGFLPGAAKSQHRGRTPIRPPSPQVPPRPAGPEVPAPLPWSPGMYLPLSGAPSRPPRVIRADGIALPVTWLSVVTAAVVCLHPDISGPIGRERQRELMARADRQRLARQLRDLGAASRRAARTRRGPHRGWRTVGVLSRLLPRYRAAR
jgi:hypothetical protein